MPTRTRRVVALVALTLTAACHPALTAGLIARHLPASRAGVVALTFDDGPHPTWTLRVLDVLDRFGVKASFFMIGSHAAAHPEVVREVARRGHRVEGHTWSHTALPKLGDAGFAADVDRANDLLGDLAGSRVRCVRPPMGAIDHGALRRLGARGLPAAMWSHDTRDWQRPGVEAIAARALDGLRSGDVVLFHDGGGDRSQTVAALPNVLRAIAARGLRVEPMC